LEEVREAFMLAVLNDRGSDVAAAEWQSLLTGGTAALQDAPALPDHPMCSCLLRRLRTSLADPELFSRGSSGLNERKVVRYLLERADRWGSFRVQESQRQIAEAIDIHQPTVAKTLRRLVDRGWIEVESARQYGVANSYLLLEQTGTDPELSTKSQTPAKTLVDNFRSAHVHPLFGADGLGPGPAETYSVLPELIRPVRPGLWTVALRAGTIGSTVPEPHASRRQVPGPLRQLDGVTVQEIVAARGLQERTIRRDLARMLAYDLVLQRDGRWYRYRCNPDAVTAELGIVDTSARKAAEPDRQRRGYFEQLSRPQGSRPARFKKLVGDGRVSFFSVSTGAEIWSCVLGHREQDTA
jgi:DNA-binding transcriptional ArsR family regulator